MDSSLVNVNKKVSSPKRLWLNFFFLLILFTMFGINFIAYQQINQFSLSNKWVLHTYSVLEASNQVLLNQLHAVSITRGYLLTSDARFIQDLEPILIEMMRNLEIVKKLTKDNPAQQKKVAVIKALIEERSRLFLKTIQLKKENKSANFNGNNLIYLGQNITDRIQSLIQNIHENEFSLLQQRNQSVERNFIDTRRIVLLTNALSALMLITIIILFNRQLTYRLETEVKSRNAVMLLKGIINGTSDYIAAVDLDMNYIAFNRTFEEEFKRIFSKRPVLGASVEESLSSMPDAIADIIALWQRALKGEEFTIIRQFGNPNLSHNKYEVTFNSIYDEKNNLIGASHIARNVANRIQEEESLKSAKASVEHSFQELKKHDAEISLINEMNSALQSASCLEETLELIKNYCSQLLNFACGTLYVMNSSRNYLEPVITWNDPEISNQVLLPEQCWSLRQGKIFRYLNTKTNIPCKHVLLTGAVHPYFCVPLLAQNDIIGLLYLQIKNYKTISEDQLLHLAETNQFLIENIAGHISLAIANIRLQEVLKVRSIRDALTGLYNRSYLDESLNRDIERAKRKSISLAIVMMDLDHFKNINDTFGHEAGDLVLMEIGKLLKAYTRQSDIACRYGGEEFLLMIYDVNENTAIKRCEQIRKEISQLAIFLGDTLIGPVRASFGIAMYPNVNLAWKELIAAADQALYQSKHTGRNKVTVYKNIPETKV